MHSSLFRGYLIYAEGCSCARGWICSFAQSRQIPAPRCPCLTKSYWSSSLIGCRSELLCSLLLLPSQFQSYLIWGGFPCFRAGRTHMAFYRSQLMMKRYVLQDWMFVFLVLFSANILHFSLFLPWFSFFLNDVRAEIIAGHRNNKPKHAQGDFGLNTVVLSCIHRRWSYRQVIQLSRKFTHRLLET